MIISTKPIKGDRGEVALLLMSKSLRNQLGFQLGDLLEIKFNGKVQDAVVERQYRDRLELITPTKKVIEALGLTEGCDVAVTKLGNVRSLQDFNLEGGE